MDDLDRFIDKHTKNAEPEELKFLTPTIVGLFIIASAVLFLVAYYTRPVATETVDYEVSYYPETGAETNELAGGPN